jgi:hypothetical protein
MWFEDKSKFENLNKSIMQVVSGQTPETETETKEEPVEISSEPPKSENTEVLKEVRKVKKGKPSQREIDKVSRDTEDEYGGMARLRPSKYKIHKEESVYEAKKSDYQLYHKDFSTAMQHSYEVAKKRGYTVDPNEIDRKVAMGPKKPSSGKSNRYILGTDSKNKRLHVQVANLDDKRHELNMYMDDFNPNYFNKKDDLYEKVKQIIDEANDAKQGAANIQKFAQQLKVPVSQVLHWDHGQGRVEYIITLKGGEQLEYTNWDNSVKIPKSANPNMKAMRDHLKNIKSIEGTKAKVADVKLGKYYLIKGIENAFKMLSK